MNCLQIFETTYLKPRVGETLFLNFGDSFDTYFSVVILVKVLYVDVFLDKFVHLRRFFMFNHGVHHHAEPPFWDDMFFQPSISLQLCEKSSIESLEKKTGREASKTHPLTMRTQFCRIFLGVILYIYIYIYIYTYIFILQVITHILNCLERVLFIVLRSKGTWRLTCVFLFREVSPQKMPPNSIYFFFVLKFQPFSLRP